MKMGGEEQRSSGQPADAEEHAGGAGPASGLVDTAVGLARISAFAWLRTAQWSARTTARAASLTMRAARSGRSPAELLSATAADAREHAQHALGIEPERYASQSAPGGTPLRERGAELLRRSADVHFDEDMHPAYERILGEISPDEGRILRLLADGPQPAVDVRTSRPLNIGSELIAPGLTMIGAEAGCRHSDRVPAYLNNLFRLGLVWFSREQVSDRLRYQVLEAQPDVVESMRRAGRARTVRRSVHLTPFGVDFCNTAMPVETSEAEAAPGDSGE
ncbi:MAG: Abi-alpha family protein [Solirubrobacterales bacterium]